MSEPSAEMATDLTPDQNSRWWKPFIGPAVAAVVLAAVVLGLVVSVTRSAWLLLGAGRGVVPEDYYPVWAFVLVLATTLGQSLGWVGGSGIAYYVMTRIGFAAGTFTWKAAMSAVYLGLGAGPLLVFHVAFGGPLLGMAREGLTTRLATDYPDAYLLLVTLHPAIDLSVIPLAAFFFGFLWLLPAERSRVARYGVALAVILTSLAVALSLASHSTLVHLRF